MRKLLVVSIVALALPTVSWADITITVDPITISSPASTYTGTFDVYVSVDSETVSVGGWQVWMDLSGGGSNVQFTNVAESTGGIFSSLPGHNVDSTLTATSVQRGESIQVGVDSPVALTNGVKLMTITYTVAPGTVGTYNLALIRTDPGTGQTVTWLSSDGMAMDDIPISLSGGTITVTPEPATVALLAAGGVVALLRRRKISRRRAA